MKLRQVIIIGVALLILVIGNLISNKLKEPKEKEAPKLVSKVVTVFTDTVRTGDVDVWIRSTGMLEAVNRMELFSEVQGVMKPDGGRFKAGTRFKKGQVLIRIKADDQNAKVISQRSTYERLVSSVLPDLRIDFADEYPIWEKYLRSLDATASTPDIPSAGSEQLKFFLTGRNVYAEYYSLKNAEIALKKYVITAPYDGVLIQANVDPGTVIRQGQALGLFVQPGVYEIESSIDPKASKFLKKGQPVELRINEADDKPHMGQIVRVNRSIDPSNQLSRFYARVSSPNLSDGMFMECRIKGQSVPDAVEIPRSVLIDGNKVFRVENGILLDQSVKAIHFTERTVIVQGLESGMEVLSKIPPGAFTGMQVVVYQTKS